MRLRLQPAKTMPVARIERVLLIGCGGTGAILAEHIARMIAGFRLRCELVLMDGDRVEEVNLARQQFLPGELGANKAVALGERLSGQLGTCVWAADRHFTGGPPDWLLAEQATLIVTATDTLDSRWLVAMGGRRQPLCWLDVGNDRHTGQAVLGTTHEGRDLAQAWRAWPRKPYPLALPDIAAVNPAVLANRRKRAGGATSCALEPFAEQGFGVNAAAALAGATIVRQALVDGQVRTPQIWFDVAAGRMLPRLITRDLLEPWKPPPAGTGKKQRQRAGRRARQ